MEITKAYVQLCTYCFILKLALLTKVVDEHRVLSMLRIYYVVLQLALLTKVVGELGMHRNIRLVDSRFDVDQRLAHVLLHMCILWAKTCWKNIMGENVLEKEILNCLRV